LLADSVLESACGNHFHAHFVAGIDLHPAVNMGGDGWVYGEGSAGCAGGLGPSERDFIRGDAVFGEEDFVFHIRGPLIRIPIRDSKRAAAASVAGRKI
jgi:hypothetical protein